MKKHNFILIIACLMASVLLVTQCSNVSNIDRFQDYINNPDNKGGSAFGEDGEYRLISEIYSYQSSKIYVSAIDIYDSDDQYVTTEHRLKNYSLTWEFFINDSLRNDWEEDIPHPKRWIETYDQYQYKILDSSAIDLYMNNNNNQQFGIHYRNWFSETPLNDKYSLDISTNELIVFEIGEPITVGKKIYMDNISMKMNKINFTDNASSTLPWLYSLETIPCCGKHPTGYIEFTQYEPETNQWSGNFYIYTFVAVYDENQSKAEIKEKKAKKILFPVVRRGSFGSAPRFDASELVADTYGEYPSWPYPPIIDYGEYYAKDIPSKKIPQ